MKMITLAAMARRTGIPSKKLRRQLEVLNVQPHIRGLVLMQRAPGRTVYVNEAALDLLRVQIEQAVAARVSDLEGRVQSLECRADDCEARRSA